MQWRAHYVPQAAAELRGESQTLSTEGGQLQAQRAARVVVVRVGARLHAVAAVWQHAPVRTGYRSEVEGRHAGVHVLRCAARGVVWEAPIVVGRMQQTLCARRGKLLLDQVLGAPEGLLHNTPCLFQLSLRGGWLLLRLLLWLLLRLLLRLHRRA